MYYVFPNPASGRMRVTAARSQLRVQKLNVAACDQLQTLAVHDCVALAEAPKGIEVCPSLTVLDLSGTAPGSSRCEEDVEEVICT